MLSLPFIIGHRRSPKAAPENTLSSFRQAARDGVTWVEFDVMLTADGHPVVFHDDALDRTSDGKGLVADVDLARLRTFAAGRWFSDAFRGERIPLLSEVVGLLRDLELAFNMELKPAPGREYETVTAAGDAPLPWTG